MVPLQAQLNISLFQAAGILPAASSFRTISVFEIQKLQQKRRRQSKNREYLNDIQNWSKCFALNQWGIMLDICYNCWRDEIAWKVVDSLSAKCNRSALN